MMRNRLAIPALALALTTSGFVMAPPLAAAAPELVCGLNQAFVSGVLEGLHAHAAVDAVLAPLRRAPPALTEA